MIRYFYNISGKLLTDAQVSTVNGIIPAKDRIKERIKAVAKKLNWQNAEVQAALWSCHLLKHGKYSDYRIELKKKESEIRAAMRDLMRSQGI